MGRIRSLATQTPAIIISLLALTLSAGGGAAYAATHTASSTASHAASPALASLSLHKLTLKHGWTSGGFGAGAPRAGISGGVVYLAGAVANPSPTSSNFARLPLSERPAHNMWITVYTSGGTTGTLFVGSDGNMYAGGSNAANFLSLAGVSFPRRS